MRLFIVCTILNVPFAFDDNRKFVILFWSKFYLIRFIEQRHSEFQLLLIQIMYNVVMEISGNFDKLSLITLQLVIKVTEIVDRTSNST